MLRRPFNPLFWLLAQAGSRARPKFKDMQGITTTVLPVPESIRIPTRHGALRAVVVRPSIDSAEPTPVILQLHGGGFINRYPEQDLHIARFLAADLGATVVLPDYETGPKARYPIAEEELFDITRWIQTKGRARGWDADRLLLSGVSAGSKLSINICQQLHAAGAPLPLAVSLTVPFTDATLTARTSSSPKPAISPLVLRAVAWSYFPDRERRREPLASPRFDPDLPAAMPPTLIQTGGVDTLAAEGAELADTLRSAGIEVVHREYPGADHDFYCSKPEATVRAMLTQISDFFGPVLHLQQS